MNYKNGLLVASLLVVDLSAADLSNNKKTNQSLGAGLQATKLKRNATLSRQALESAIQAKKG